MREKERISTVDRKEKHREILYSYTWRYLRFNRAYIWRKEFDGSKRQITSSFFLRTSETEARPCETVRDHRPWRASAPSLCSCLRKLLTLIAHSGKAPFSSGSYLSGDTSVDCFLHEALPHRWETCKTWQSLHRTEGILLHITKISGLRGFTARARVMMRFAKTFYLLHYYYNIYYYNICFINYFIQYVCVLCIQN